MRSATGLAPPDHIRRRRLEDLRVELVHERDRLNVEQARAMIHSALTAIGVEQRWLESLYDQAC